MWLKICVLEHYVSYIETLKQLHEADSFLIS